MKMPDQAIAERNEGLKVGEFIKIEPETSTLELLEQLTPAEEGFSVYGVETGEDGQMVLQYFGTYQKKAMRKRHGAPSVYDRDEVIGTLLNAEIIEDSNIIHQRCIIVDRVDGYGAQPISVILRPGWFHPDYELAALHFPKSPETGSQVQYREYTKTRRAYKVLITHFYNPDGTVSSVETFANTAIGVSDLAFRFTYEGEDPNELPFTGVSIHNDEPWSEEDMSSVLATLDVEPINAQEYIFTKILNSPDPKVPIQFPTPALKVKNETYSSRRFFEQLVLRDDGREKLLHIGDYYVMLAQDWKEGQEISSGTKLTGIALEPVMGKKPFKITLNVDSFEERPADAGNSEHTSLSGEIQVEIDGISATFQIENMRSPLEDLDHFNSRPERLIAAAFAFATRRNLEVHKS